MPNANRFVCTMDTSGAPRLHSTPMDQLALPIGALMRPTFAVDLQDSLELAARKLRDNGCGLLPVLNEGFFEGAITEASLATALGSGQEMTDSVEAITKGALTALPSMTGAQALRLFEDQGALGLIVIDDRGRVMGILTPSDLYPKRLTPPRPPMVGGMATPFGVYLTTGTIRAGVSHLALMTTGMTLFGLMLLATVGSVALSDLLNRNGLSATASSNAQGFLFLAIFLVAMRAIPLSGIHAAEHKVVHAIERGEELIPSTVRRMPRVHPRCGTNIAVGASLLTGIGTAEFIPYPEVRLLTAAIVTLMFWRPLGNAMQRYVTTKKPTDKQLAMGIKSGRELLQRHASHGAAGASVLQRIVNSGMLHVIGGSTLAFFLVELIAYVFHIPTEHYLSF